MKMQQLSVLYANYYIIIFNNIVHVSGIKVNYTGRFIKNQQKYAKLIQLFTSALRNKNTERKGKNTSRCSLHYITPNEKQTNKKKYSHTQTYLSK